MTDSNSMVRATRVLTIGVPVRDQNRALDFYTNVLGFDVRRDFPIGDDARWIEVTPPAGETTIALTLANAATPAGVETGIRLCAEDADAFRQHLLNHGASAEEVLRWPGVPPMFAFRDLDGNRLEIVQES